MGLINIKLRFILTILLSVILLSSGALAASKLLIKDIDVKVGGKTDKDLDDGDTIDRDAEPGDQVEVKVKLENNFTASEDLDIEDTTVTTTIEEIDDGDDLDDESSEFDLKQGKTKTVTFNFKVPILVDEDSFNIVIEAEGDDENGTNQEASATIELNVDKDNDNLLLETATLSPSAIKCQKSISISGKILNIGSNDQDEVVYEVMSSELGINIRQANIEMSEDIDEDDNEFERTDTYVLPKNLAAGQYPVIFTAYYDTNNQADTKTVFLTVEECAQTAGTATGTTQQTTPQAGQQPSAGTTQVTVSPSEQIYPVIQEESSFFDQPVYLVLAALVYLVVIAIGVMLVVRAARK